MKPHELTVEDIIAEMRAEMEQEISAVGRQTTPEELAAATIAMRAALGDFIKNKIQTQCIACGTIVPMVETTACACRGFVCHHCRKLEVEGVCDHEPPQPPPG